MSRLIDVDTIKIKPEYMHDICGVVMIRVEDVARILNDMPTIKPEPHWIPCSETVDIPDHEILACDKYGEEVFGYLAYEDDQWLCESDDCMMYDPIAWREKPEPYKPESEE